MSAATPSVIPITEIPVILEIKDTDFGLTRYRRAIRNLKFNVAVYAKRDEYTIRGPSPAPLLPSELIALNSVVHWMKILVSIILMGGVFLLPNEALLFAQVPSQYAQPFHSTSRPPVVSVDTLTSGTALGLQVVLNNSGFGLGVYYSKEVAPEFRIALETSLGAAKDEREVAFFDRFGRRDVPNKSNYLLEIPVHIGVEKRFFRAQIEDNFRPFLLMKAGPLLGWAYPYYDDENNNGLLDNDEPSFDILSGLTRGHIEPGVSVGLFIGAHFGAPESTSQGIRIGYQVSYYKNKIALLDESIKAASRRIGTPVIAVYFGRAR